MNALNDKGVGTEFINKYLRTVIVLLGIICVAIVGFLAVEMQTLIVPFVLALLISFILNPIIQSLRNLHIPESLSIFIVLLATFLILFLVGQLVNMNIKSFIANFSQYEVRMKTITKKIIEVGSIFNSGVGIGENNSEFPALSAIIQNVSLRNMVTSILGSVSALLSDTFLVLLYLLFLLSGKGKLVQKLDLAFDTKIAVSIKEVILRVNREMNRYIVTKTLISLLTAGLVLIVLWLFGVEFAFVWALLTFALNFIPNIGSIIATLFPIVFALVQFDNTMTIVWIATCLLVIQTIVGNILEPKIVGKSMNLSPLVVLIALMFWGYAWGIVGMILAVPFAVLIKIIMENIPGLKPVSILMGDQSR